MMTTGTIRVRPGREADARAMMVKTPGNFYFLRFLLGAAEAGFFPGMILYLKMWFPEAARARAVALFMTAGPLVAAFASWVRIARTIRQDPTRLTGRRFGALALKMVFFAAFVVWAIRGVHVEPIPFAVSFAAAFITLHGVEAMWLRRALARLTSGASGTPN